MNHLELQQRQNRAAFNSIAAQQQAAGQAAGQAAFGGLGGLGQAACFGISHASGYVHNTSIEYEMQNDLDAYLKDWKGE